MIDFGIESPAQSEGQRNKNLHEVVPISPTPHDANDERLARFYADEPGRRTTAMKITKVTADLMGIRGAGEHAPSCDFGSGWNIIATVRGLTRCKSTEPNWSTDVLF
jgi:hypothetical protein